MPITITTSCGTSRLPAGPKQGRFGAMRALLALLLVLCTAPALAAGWTRYDNARFGYTIEVPSGFTWGREADNGDGRSFRDGPTKLLVWGANLMAADFEAAARAERQAAQAEGWQLSYEAITPSWASFSGTLGQRILYRRMILVCGTQLASFQLEYSQVDRQQVDPMVDHLVRTLQPANC